MAEVTSMIKMIIKPKMFIALLMVLIIAIGFVGCKKKDKNNDEYQANKRACNE